MHELSIAMSILEMGGRRSRATRQRAGVAAIRRGWEVVQASSRKPRFCQPTKMARECSAKDTRLVIDEIPIIVFCPSCRSSAVKLDSAVLLRDAGLLPASEMVPDLKWKL